VGGLIVDTATWQWIFVVNVPIAILAIALAVRLLKKDAGRADAGPLDWVGALILCPGLAGVVFGLSETESQGGIDHPVVFGPIVAGLVLIGLFARHSVRVPRPLIDLHLFVSRSFRAAATTTFLLGAALYGAMLIIPLYYQVDRGESALTAGLLLAPQGIGAAFMLPISGRLTDRLGGGPVVLAGCTIAAVATVPWMFITANTPYVLLGAMLFVRGLGLGASIQPSIAAAYTGLESVQVPRASAVLNTLRQLGGSIGTALLAVVLQNEGAAALAGSGGGDLLTPLPPSERASLGGPVATAFGSTFTWAVLMAVLTILPALALFRAQRSHTRLETSAKAGIRRAGAV
jgi:EmrB/QacA subfamily drug resistance transporter